MQETLKQGDRVLTTGGMYGTVLGIHDDVIVLKIGDNAKAEFSRTAITGLINKKGES